MDRNINVRRYFYPLVSNYKCYKGRFNCDAMPAAWHAAEKILALPIYRDLKLKDIDKIYDIILS